MQTTATWPPFVTNAYQGNFPTAPSKKESINNLPKKPSGKMNPQPPAALHCSYTPTPPAPNSPSAPPAGAWGNITIYDTSGRPVMQANAGGGASEHRMDIGAQAPGIYIVQATCGDEVHAEKLVVTR